MTVSAPEQNVDYQQIWETVCQRIRASILSGKLPAGAKLVESDLAQSFKVSRGPIREALRELSREGLVVDLPRRGTFVCTLTQVDLTEIYDVREALELMAAREAIARATDAELAGLREAHEVMEKAWSGTNWTAAVTADNRFHLALVRLAKNKRMETIYEQMGAQTVLHIVTASETDLSLRRAPIQAIHRSIADSVVSRNAKAAEQAIADHYRYTRSRLFEGLDNGPPAPS